MQLERDKNLADYLAVEISNRILNGLGRMLGG